MLQKVELGFTLRNILLQLATLKFVAWQVEHGVMIRATARARSTCNATLLRDKLKGNVARQYNLALKPKNHQSLFQFGFL